MLLDKIKEIYHEHKGRYGSPRITIQLKREGIKCSVNRVARLMRQNNIIAKIKQRYKYTERTKHNYRVAENVINQDFSATDINQKWASDITYIYTSEGWLYLAGVLDLYSRRIVGWAMGDQLTRELVIKALKQALKRRDVEEGLIIHSDQGVQYTCNDYVNLIRENNLIQSMSNRGNCYDNAAMESFFKTLKSELTDWYEYNTREEAKRDLFQYIEAYYNRKRLHSSLGYMSPVEFESSFN